MSALAAIIATLRSLADALEQMPPPLGGHADELRPITALADEFGLERRGLAAAIRRAGIPTLKIGRARAVRRSDVLSLVERLGESRAPQRAPTSSATDDDYAAIVAQARGKRVA